MTKKLLASAAIIAATFSFSQLTWAADGDSMADVVHANLLITVADSAVEALDKQTEGLDKMVEATDKIVESMDKHVEAGNLEDAARAESHQSAS